MKTATPTIFQTMAQTLNVSLESPQHGFMSLRLKTAGQSFVTVVAHEPYDSLRDLIAALSAVIDGDGAPTVKWNSEPDEYEFRFQASGDRVLLEVIHYPDHRKLAETAATVFSFEGPKADACLSFLEELRDLRSRAGRDEFDRQWRRAFPERELQELTKRMDT
ncbi:MAG TPA: hypothetical protein VJ715_04350 [Pyrinomonadaceae bacterium]|nr:hypothetical protein [Pyrinomonadaceae bacterium]